MKIVHISDTHTRHNDAFLTAQLKEINADVIVHSGDFSHSDWNSTKTFFDWFLALDFEHKILVPGNHDRFTERLNTDAYARKQLMPAGLNLLIDEEIEIDGVKFYGSPFTPAFHDWAFQIYGDAGVEKWNQIPDDVNVLITHGPAKGLLDAISELKNDALGCPFLKERIQQLPNLKAHLFGHIHGGYGREEINGVLYLNSSILDEKYRVTNKPQVFEI